MRASLSIILLLLAIAPSVMAGWQQDFNRQPVESRPKLEVRYTGGTRTAFEIVADRFLHRMVRYVVAVLIDLAREARPEGELRTLLSGRSGAAPPRPAPPAGLYLTGVRYGDGWNRRPGVPGLWPLAGARLQAGPRSV